MSIEKWSSIKDNIGFLLNSKLLEIAQELSGDKNCQRDIIERIERVLTDKIIDDEKIETQLYENIELKKKRDYEDSVYYLSTDEIAIKIKEEVINDENNNEKINFLYNQYLINFTKIIVMVIV